MHYHRISRSMNARLLVLFSAAFLPACDAVKYPLTDPDHAKPDERLFGAWKYMSSDKDDSCYWYLFIGGSGTNYVPPGIMKAVEVSNDKENKKIHHSTLFFFQATLGRANYAHVIDNATSSPSGFMQRDRPCAKYYLVKYIVDGDRLTIWLMDLRAAATAITNGQLKGKIIERGILKWKTVQITETAKGLSQFLARGGDKVLFPDANKLIFAKAK